jgi:hypothetical protein
MAAAGVNHPRRGAAAHDCFHHPEVAEADDRLGDVWITRPAQVIAAVDDRIRPASSPRPRLAAPDACICIALDLPVTA